MTDPSRKVLRRVADRASSLWYVRALLGGALVGAILLAVVAWTQYAGTATDQRVALTFLINLIGVLAFQVFMGNSGVPTFGHVGFIAIGAYTAAILTTPPERKSSATLIPDAPGFLLDAEFSFLPALVVAVAVVALVAALTGKVIVRLRGGSAAISTLALLIIIRTVIGNSEDFTRGPKTWSGIPAYTDIWMALAVVVVVIIIARLYRESGAGLRLRATRTDELASSAVGVDISRERFGAWVLSACIAGAAGVVWAGYFLSLSPQDFFFDLTFLYIVMSIIGGPTVSGAVAGAGAVTFVTEFLRRVETDGISLGPIEAEQIFGLTPIALGLLVLGTVILRPEGILGRWELDEWLIRARRTWRSRRAHRHRGRGPTRSNRAPAERVGNQGSDGAAYRAPAAPSKGTKRASRSQEPAPAGPRETNQNKEESK